MAQAQAGAEADDMPSQPPCRAFTLDKFFFGGQVARHRHDTLVVPSRARAARLLQALHPGDMRRLPRHVQMRSAHKHELRLLWMLQRGFATGFASTDASSALALVLSAATITAVPQTLRTLRLRALQAAFDVRGD